MIYFTVTAILIINKNDNQMYKGGLLQTYIRVQIWPPK